MRCTLALIFTLAAGLVTAAGPETSPWKTDRFSGFYSCDVTDLSDALPENFSRSIGSQKGALVLSVAPGSPAAKAGLRKFNIVTMVNGENVETAEQLASEMKKTPSDETQILRVEQPTLRRNSFRWKSRIIRFQPVPIADWAGDRVSVSKDTISGVTTLEPREKPNITRGSGFYAYAVAKGGQKDTFIRFYRSGDDWLFMKRFEIRSGGETYLESRGFFDVERDNSAGRVWEYCDVPFAGDVKEALQAMMQGSPATLRFSGEQYREDHEVSEIELYDTMAVIAAAEAL
ncbi:PDZ domain-containing protein [Roseiconus nitratireducens]|nr:PDZ domain-containing protein [Roseiconus nitratireducens]